MHLPDIATSPSGGFMPYLRKAVVQHRLLAALVLGYALISVCLSLTIEVKSEAGAISGLALHFLQMLPAMAYFLLMWRFLTMRRTVPAAQRPGWLKADIRRSLTDPERLASAAVSLVLMTVVLLSFAQLKKMIPIMQPFSWDETFIAVDQALHFGLDPWKIAHAVAGNPYVITAVTGAYNFWMFLMYFSLIFACFSMAKRAERMQYLVAFLLTWAIGGNVLATVFSSAGPVYVERLGLGDHFAPLMAILRDHAASQPVTVIEIQDVLWSFYAAPESMNGISAFPSMHVASTVLMALYARSYSHRFGQVMTGFACVIMLGSVLLAWHYAVDGYAGALIALACWWLAGRLVRRFAAEEPAVA